MSGQEQDREALARVLPCSQCGQKLADRACGPTHAILTAQPERHRLLAEVVRGAEQRAWESGARAGHHSPLTWYALRQCNPYNLARHAGADQ